MAGKTAKIIGVTTILGILGWGAYKAVPALTKVARIGENFIVSSTFNRIHGLVNTGDILQKLLNPVLRVFMNVDLKNFSGFDLGITNAFIKLEYQGPGSKEWTTIGSSPTQFSISVKDKKTQHKELPIDINGWPALTSLGNKLNKHRAVLIYDFKGLPQRDIIPLSVAASVNAYLNKIKGGSALKGAEPTNQNMLLWI